MGANLLRVPINDDTSTMRERVYKLKNYPRADPSLKFRRHPIGQ
jgi:hypothetical protein